MLRWLISLLIGLGVASWVYLSLVNDPVLSITIFINTVLTFRYYPTEKAKWVGIVTCYLAFVTIFGGSIPQIESIILGQAPNLDFQSIRDMIHAIKLLVLSTGVATLSLTYKLINKNIK
jgi:hypothetical protein